MKTTTLTISNPISDSLLRCALILIPFVLICVATLPAAHAVVPAPDGGYPNFNTAEGTKALFSLTTGSANTAVGWFSLESLTTGSFNTGVGAGTLVLNSGDENTATGVGALLLNTIGFDNTANGALALFNNTIGVGNTAMGDRALQFNATGLSNTAVGAQALFRNTTGGFNTAHGFGALGNNTEGGSNTAMGVEAMGASVHGFANVAVGDSAGAGVEGDFNIYLGAFVHPSAPAPESETIRIGNTFNEACFIGGISGQTASGGVAVFIDADGKLGTMTSSRRFKDEIKPMGKASEAILALKPVSFRYRKEIDPQGIPQFGLVAEEVEKVNRDLVVRDKDGKSCSVRYDQVNAMLLNEFLKEHCKNEEQEATITQLKAELQTTATRQQKQIESLTAGLQKVNAKLATASPSRGGLEASKFATGRIRGGGPAPQVANNP